MFIDVHVHASKYPAPTKNGKLLFSVCALPTPEEVLKRYDEVGIERGVLQPLIGPEVYLPQSNEEILEIAEGYSGRLIPFCNVDPRALTNSPDAPLGELLRYYRDRGCKGIGELMPNLPFLDPMVQNLFKHAQESGLPLTFDGNGRLGGTYGLYDEVGLPQLECCLQRFPDLKILGHGPMFWAEIGQLETVWDRTGYPKYPIKEEGVVPKLMRRYGNLYGDLSAGSGFNALARDPDYAVRFLNEFEGRLMFGTDICTPEMPTPLVDFLLELKDSGKISQAVFNKIARENAIEILRLEEA